MARTITIDPVTRIEGHSKITIHLDDQGRGGGAQHRREHREQEHGEQHAEEQPVEGGRAGGDGPVAAAHGSASASPRKTSPRCS